MTVGLGLINDGVRRTGQPLVLSTRWCLVEMTPIEVCLHLKGRLLNCNYVIMIAYVFILEIMFIKLKGCFIKL